MEKNSAIIRPGLATDIVDQNRHMKSMIYDVVDRRIIIAQTAPPLTKYNLKQPLALTVLVQKEGRPVRYGVQAEVVDFIKNYALVSTSVMAVEVEQKNRIDIYDLRMDFRVRPPAGSDLCIEMKNQLLNVIDTSVGGFRFSYRGHDLPIPGQEIEIKLIVGGVCFNLSAVILGITAPAFHDPKIRIVRAEFTGSRRDYEQCLMKKIIEIQRKLLAAGRLL